MSKLQPLEEWRMENFTSPPTAKTVRNWCMKGEINAKKIGRNWFVIVNNDVPKRSRVGSLIDKVLNG